MRDVDHIPQNDLWVEQLFSAKQVARGGVLRRSIVDIDRKIGRMRLMQEVEARGFRLLEAGGQYIIICTRKPMRLLV
ncbi:hypothetical protein JANAI62_23880 [Jannaschia pagri]|uniref:N-(5'-phosphoribosyl)anthranilate isomerase n=1 Tax=Jannaschia pagri TaxID=2829797 RepID=A0ABQ4NMY4_9RHOB|nr:MULTISPECIES: N-(5'-phosphoribosyl)anthranilate isomerase [unclassified Jannaschia]GIT91931.1 hypothetical protein JANAI61_23890 [Jannaschia sp. AI_61]GIT95765.1 hypothetical protein JANAI62_23880 [Jannaschia sp. AI_62]